MHAMRHCGRLVIGLVMALVLLEGPASADKVTLNSGVVLEGEVDKDATILTIYDDLKRVIVRDTKVARVETSAVRRFEEFRVDQPLVVHGGKMPTAVVAVQAGSWDDKGRRHFRYVGAGASSPREMTQAINGLGPRMVQIRGVDAFWRTRLATSQVPRSIILAILAKIDQKNQQERLKAGQLLIQAEWYPEALVELERIASDFPELAATVATVRAMVVELQAGERLAEIQTRRRALQFHAVHSLLDRFPTDGAPDELLRQIRSQLVDDERQRTADRELSRKVREAAMSLPAALRTSLQAPTIAMLQDLAEAPDAVRDRFEPFLRGVDSSVLRVESEPPRVVAASSGETTPEQEVESDELEDDAAATPSRTNVTVQPSSEALYALALSGWVGGSARADTDLDVAVSLWDARDQLLRYLRAQDESSRERALEALRAMSLPDASGAPQALRPDVLADIASHAPPPLRDPREEVAGTPRRLRARDDDNPEPTEYALLLPPEYHHARRYPALVALHSGDGPEAASLWWADEASRRGYIIIAPEYNLAGKPKDYRYSPDEHAAVEIALRDARRRFSIDSDRVFLAGTTLGGTMAWDVGLAHPDLFAGMIVLNGLPAKFVWTYRDHAALIPMYLAMGELAPAEPDLILPFGTSLVARNYDVMYTEYFDRGLEPLPEEIPAAFNWMDSRSRDPYPKEFSINSAREGDSRYFGVVLREHAEGRAKSPDEADPLGKGINPAKITVNARTLANLLDVTTSGVNGLDLWLGPPHIDLTKRLEIRINGRTTYKGDPTIDIAPFLEDLRIRGDREQVYWLKYSISPGRARR